MYGAMDNPSVSSTLDQDRIPATDILGFKRRRLSALKKLDWAFLFTSTLSLIVVAGLTIQRIVIFAPRLSDGIYETSGTDFAFATVLLVNTVFCLYYVYSGVFRERLYEMIMFMGGTVVVVVYCIVNMITSQNRNDLIKIIRLSIACVFGPINLSLAFLMVRSFGWLEFRVVGASETLQKMFRQRSLCFSFISFDVQAAASFLALSLSDGNSFQMLRILLVGLGIPLSLAWAAAGSACIQSERRGFCVLWAILGMLVPAFVIYRLVCEFVRYLAHYQDPFFFYGIIIVGFVCLGVRFGLFVFVWKTSQNFGKGLKNQVFNFSAIQDSVVEVRQLLHK